MSVSSITPVSWARGRNSGQDRVLRAEKPALIHASSVMALVQVQGVTHRPALFSHLALHPLPLSSVHAQALRTHLPSLGGVDSDNERVTVVAH